jgi:3-oxoadipate enol-lactonase
MLRTINSTLLNVVDEGEGPPLIFIHGLGANFRNWQLQIESFSPEFRCICPDNRGAGQSAATPGPYSFDLFAEDLAAICDDLGVARAHIVGQSMGGMIAQAFACAYPQRVDKLVLVDTSCFAGEVLQATLVHADAMLREHGMGVLPAMFTDAIYSEAFRAAHPEEIARFNRELTSHNIEGILGSIGAIAELDFRDRLLDVATPTLLILGALDQITPPSDTDLISSLMPHARRLTFPMVGHQPHVEVAEAFNVALREFLLAD